MSASLPLESRFVWRCLSLRLLFVILSLAIPAAVVGDAKGQETELSEEGRVFFEKQVRPLLVNHCLDCHGGTRASGGLSLDSSQGWAEGGDSGPAIVPGNPDDSLLMSAIRYESIEMPPSDHGGPLAEQEIEILSQWITMGAPDPRDGSDRLGGMDRKMAADWWAFQPLPNLPAATFESDVRWIDQALNRQLAQHALDGIDPADRRTLLRRLTYDLTGLPPTDQQVSEFEADQSEQAWSQQIDRLLATREYGQHWGRHWLDVVRYADTAGENTDRPLPHAWRYRNWVLDSFHNDHPFDQMIRMQLAGDLLTEQDGCPSHAEGVIATGYLAIARRFGHDIDKDMYLTYEDVIDNLGKNFLGLTIGCARCHDHKYDPIDAEDYYALYGIFQSSRFSYPGCEPFGQPRDLVPLLTEDQRQEFLKPWSEQQERWEQLQQKIISLAAQALPDVSSQSRSLIQEADVGEGQSVDLNATTLTVQRGDTLLLTVLPGGNHGADSTLVDLKIHEVEGGKREWSTQDLLDQFTRSNPRQIREATWCLLELTEQGPAFLYEAGDSIEGNPALQKWSHGDTPSVFVNSANQIVSVWTALPARTFFVHPGQNVPVAVAWISPLDGQIKVQGRVADAHPAALDGVRFRWEHIKGPEAGEALLEAGRIREQHRHPPGPQPALPVAYAVVEAEPVDAKLQMRGDPEKQGPEIPRRWLSVFGGEQVPEGQGSGRRQLADWIATHPLTARVMVNRIWEWHFGQGLVRSSNDFGSRGQRPSHPELLDFLATRFVQSGYSIKAMHRLILQTEAYRRQSATAPEADPENQWLSCFARRRLSAEELRDSLLLISGTLDTGTGQQHPFPEPASWTYTQHNPFHAVYETDLRSVFLMVQRQQRHPYLALFDGADPNASTPARQATSVPTQALYFLNDPFFHRQAQRLAEHVLSTAGEDQAVQQIYACLFQRPPSAKERQRAQRFLSDYPGTAIERWSAYCRVLLASNEFLYVE